MEDLQDIITEQVAELKQADERVKELEVQLAISNELLKKEQAFVIHLQNKFDLT